MAGTHPLSLPEATIDDLSVLVEQLVAGPIRATQLRQLRTLRRALHYRHRVGLDIGAPFRRRSASGQRRPRGELPRLLDEVVLPELAGALLDSAPLPGDRDERHGRSDLIELAGAFIELGSLLAEIGYQPDRLRHEQTVTEEIFRRTERYYAALQSEPVSDEHPDLARVIQDMTRLRILRWIVSMLGAGNVVRYITTVYGLTARYALNRVTEIISNALTERDIATRFEAASVLVEHDEITYLVDEVLNHGLGDEDEGEDRVREKFVASGAGVETVTALMKMVTAYCGLTIRELGDRLTDPAQPESGVRSSLMDLETVMSLVRNAEHPLMPVRVARFERTVQKALLEAGRELIDGRATLGPAGVSRRLERLAGFALGQEWPALSDTLRDLEARV